jgi:hypothetical protein
MRYEVIFHVDAREALKLLRWAEKAQLEPTTIWDRGPDWMSPAVTIARDEAIAVIESQKWQRDTPRPLRRRQS